MYIKQLCVVKKTSTGLQQKTIVEGGSAGGRALARPGPGCSATAVHAPIGGLVMCKARLKAIEVRGQRGDMRFCVLCVDVFVRYLFMHNYGALHFTHPSRAATHRVPLFCPCLEHF